MYSECLIPREYVGADLLFTVTPSGLYTPGPGVVWVSIGTGSKAINTHVCLTCIHICTCIYIHTYVHTYMYVRTITMTKIGMKNMRSKQY